MKPLAIALAALLALQPQSGGAQAARAAPDAALVERFLAVLPDPEEISALGLEVDQGELEGLAALNPGKETQVREILQAHLPCTREAVSALSLRMLRTIARDLGDARLRRLVSFYEGPDYAAFNALAGRLNGNSAPSPEDEAAMAKLMADYPLQAFHDAMGRSLDIIAADELFMGEATKCASEQMEALEAAGLKSH